MNKNYSEIVREEIKNILIKAVKNDKDKVTINVGCLHKEIKEKYIKFKNSKNHSIISGVLYKLEKYNSQVNLTKNTPAGKGGASVTIECDIFGTIIYINNKKVIMEVNLNTCNENINQIYAEEIEESVICYEGAKKKVTVNAYERNSQARIECLKKYGYSCQICGFDSSKFYGENFKNKIQVHHIKPLSEIRESYQVDPIHDLIPVCPNCHMIIHSKENGEVYSVAEVKEFIKNNSVI